MKKWRLRSLIIVGGVGLELFLLNSFTIPKGIPFAIGTVSVIIALHYLAMDCLETFEKGE